LEHFSVAFVGAGNMTGSMIGGLLAAGFPVGSLAAADPLEANRNRLGARGVRVSESNREAVAGADVIVLAVKPQVLRSVCEDLAGCLTDEQVLISIAAGIPAASVVRWLGEGPRVVRCMPNTPALLGEGASALCPHGDVPEHQREQAAAVLGAVGRVCWIEDEDLMHAVTALSGSGPAYFFQFMEAMIASAVTMGLDEETARTLCAQTCAGAGQMLLQGDSSAAELRQRVCSPGGTTERAVESFTAARLDTVVDAAMVAALNRSRELQEELA
jgi:pyrroline-5-carboxylate reductase